MAGRGSPTAFLLRRALLAAVLTSTVALAACTGGGDGDGDGDGPKRGEPTGRAASADGCRPEMRSGKLPGWADSGFTDGRTGHFVLGEHGRILGVVFGYPLTARSVTRPGRQNKVRWIPRDMAAAVAAGRLRITAVLAGDGRTVRRVVDPWPDGSVIDMPVPGCWSFTLRWGHASDTVDLRYRD